MQRSLIASMILGIFLLSSCQSGFEGFREKGRASTRSLIEELKNVRTKDQLLIHRDSITAHFKDLADLYQKAKDYADQHPLEELPLFDFADHELSEELKLEILRIYRLEGGREILNYCRRLKN